MEFVAWVSNKFDFLLLDASQNQLKMFNIFESNSDKSDYFNALLAEANEKGAWMWKLYFRYILFGFIVASIVQYISSFSYCFLKVGHFDSNYVYYPYKIV